MIEETIQKLKINLKEPIVVAVSGGPDSMALLSMLGKLGFETIICAHVHHNSGRTGQDEDEKFVKEYCEKYQYIFESMKIESYDKDNFHNQAHKKRYQFFEIIMKKYHCQYLFTAHHGDDLMETMLFRMMRGSTIKALHGFSAVSEKNGYIVVRPLLKYTKDELLQYNIENHIPYQIDSSNEKDVYTRNRIRKNILPFMRQEQRNVHLKFLDISSELEEMEICIRKIAYKKKEKWFCNHMLDITDWDSIDKIIQKRILQMVLSDIYMDKQEMLEKVHIELLQNLISNAKSGTKLVFPKNLIVKKEYQTILFGETKANSYEYVLEKDTKLPNGHEIKFLQEEETDSNFVCRIKKEELVFPLLVRTRKAQDKMQIKGMNGRKKIKEIFINSKIPEHLRASYPIVTDNTGKIVWIPGVKKSQFDKTKEEKYDIILRYY
ncbi:MAG: tRNA lysidine(34) synthetase TilS [Bacilli bacterium]|nr:tRNA lysidine(34) synthetase TilS [Bacilli bacterium]